MMRKVIYTLALSDGAFYVGSTTRPVSVRFQEHVDGKGSSWTTLYKPVSVIREVVAESPLDEDFQVKRMMSTHGIANVRGGAYSRVLLPTFQRRALVLEMRSARGSCLRCGNSTHFISDCEIKAIWTCHRCLRINDAHITVCPGCGEDGGLLKDEHEEDDDSSSDEEEDDGAWSEEDEDSESESESSDTPIPPSSTKKRKVSCKSSKHKQ